MTDSTKKTLISEGADCHLFIAVASGAVGSDASVIVDQVSLLQNRFGFSAVVVCSSPADIGLSTIRNALRDNLFEQVVCSGEANYVNTDVFAAAKRAIRKNAIFVHSVDLIKNLPDLLKFIIESSNQSQGSTVSRCNRFLFTAQGLLKRAALQTVSKDWIKAIRAAALELNSVNLGTFAPFEEKSSSKSSHVDAEIDAAVQPLQKGNLFVTLNGANRLGGLSKMKSLPLSFASTPVSQFAQYWIIDNDITADEVSIERSGRMFQIHTIKGFEQIGKDDRYLIFDINPAPLLDGSSKSDHETSTITVPRQVLYARVVNGLKPAVQQDSTVFIVSNHNKARYIPSTLYSMIMQSYPKIRIDFVDDLSTDNSVALAQNFQDVLGIRRDMLDIAVNAVNRGTYWIRNSVIAKHINSSCVFLVNDSDDYSAAQRVYLQGNLIAMQADRFGCFGDIVRVDKNYRLLPLGEQVERYGTASLACKAELHNEAGYFQNIRKNADTEFIERIKTFLGPTAIKWFRYPVLFQPFDGGNLTADIYSLEENGNQIVQSLSNRSSHTEAFKKHHARITRSILPKNFTFPLSSLTEDYAEISCEFHIAGYSGLDSCLLISRQVLTPSEIEKLYKKGFHIACRSSAGGWEIGSSILQERYQIDAKLSEALSSYMQKQNFFGYVLSLNLIGVPAEDMGLPTEILSGVLGQHVFRSKSHGDRHSYIMNYLETEKTKHFSEVGLQQLFMHLDQSTLSSKESLLFFHSEMLRKLLSDPKAVIKAIELKDTKNAVVPA